MPAVQAASPQTQTLSQTANTPRFDDYERLKHRFYEAVLLLLALGQTRGSRTSVQFSGSQQSVRRRFLNNLCYVCDYLKGGDTTTAIGLDHCPEKYTFWVAANVNTETCIVPFLNDRLCDLKEISASTDEERNARGAEFKRVCVEFARRRIKKEARLLCRRITECRRYLTASEGLAPADQTLAVWLHRFQTTTVGLDLCELAYSQRKSPHMDELRQRSQEPRYKISPDSLENCYKQIQHSIGRLAHHIRAACELVTDSIPMAPLLDAFEVQHIPLMPSMSKPIPDGLTTPPSILKRMLPSSKLARLPQYLEAFTILDTKYNISSRFRANYTDSNFRPRVHAEIQVAEHFFSSPQLSFSDADRYIATSKPACYCCHLYLRYHPERFVELETHMNVYRNWGPPLLRDGSQDRMYTHQRDILNAMLKVMREEALAQLLEKRAPLRHQADSHTGITDSVGWDCGSDVGDDSEVDFGEEVNLSSSDMEDESQDEGLSSPSPGSFDQDLRGYRFSEADDDSDGGVPLTDLHSVMGLS